MYNHVFNWDSARALLAFYAPALGVLVLCPVILVSIADRGD